MTTEEKQKRKEKTRELVKKVLAIPPSERQALAMKYGQRTPENHQLSPFNQVFLAYQGVTSAIVGGFQQWKRAGRVVRKGEHSRGSIFVPIGKRFDVKLDGKTETITEATNFITVAMFGLEQTEALAESEKGG